MSQVNVKFEMGQINPNNWEMDHHGPVTHSQNFVIKMSAVQLIEAIVMKGVNPEDIVLEVNHAGHLDDICAHAIAPAAAAGKLRALYRFACIASVVDSCGPSGYLLVQKSDKAAMDAVYGEYHRLTGAAAKEAGCQKWQLPLASQVEASKAAGKMLVDLLPVDDYEAAVPDAPSADTYEVVDKTDGIWVVRILDADRCNTIRFSGYFYGQGAKAVVGYFKRGERVDYSACIRSAYDGDLSGVWPQLAAQETIPPKCRNWGGHSGAGGSPMRDEKSGFPGGSVRTPDEVCDLVRSALK